MVWRVRMINYRFVTNVVIRFVGNIGDGRKTFVILGLLYEITLLFLFRLHWIGWKVRNGWSGLIGYT